MTDLDRLNSCCSRRPLDGAARVLNIRTALPRGKRLQKRAKKNREENKFSSRVEVRIATPKAFGAVNERWALVPLSLRCFFLCCFFLLCHRLDSPLSIRKVRRSVKSWE